MVLFLLMLFASDLQDQRDKNVGNREVDFNIWCHMWEEI